MNKVLYMIRKTGKKNSCHQRKFIDCNNMQGNHIATELKKVFQIFLGLFTLSLSWLSYCRGGSILSLLEIPLTRLVNKS